MPMSLNYQLIAADAANQATGFYAYDTGIDKVALTVFPFACIEREVLLAGTHPGGVYKRTHNWIMSLEAQPGPEGEKDRMLAQFIAKLLPISPLNESLGRTMERSVPPEVASQFAEDYLEAARVLNTSPKASAALSRRLLQQLLEEKGGMKSSELGQQIQQVLDSKALPSYLAEAIDAVRWVGNFAAHPIKSKDTGKITPVEPGEADWLLDVIEGLFDFYFVQPVRLGKRRDALNEKLKSAGRPLLKSGK